MATTIIVLALAMMVYFAQDSAGSDPSSLSCSSFVEVFIVAAIFAVLHYS
jgi:hypothetical protein